MAKRKPTGFDRYLQQRMRDPKFAADYRQARAEVAGTDTLLRALDAARERAGMSKADLARRIDTKPEVIRRLLTAADGNPTMETVLKVAAALGCHLELVMEARPTRRPRPGVLASERRRAGAAGD